MLLLITIHPDLRIRLHSDDAKATALATTYLGKRTRTMLEKAVSEGGTASEFAAALSGSIDDADRLALAAFGFAGVAVAQLFDATELESKWVTVRDLASRFVDLEVERVRHMVSGLGLLDSRSHVTTTDTGEWSLSPEAAALVERELRSRGAKLVG